MHSKTSLNLNFCENNEKRGTYNDENSAEAQSIATLIREKCRYINHIQLTEAQIESIYFLVSLLLTPQVTSCVSFF